MGSNPTLLTNINSNSMYQENSKVNLSEIIDKPESMSYEECFKKLTEVVENQFDVRDMSEVFENEFDMTASYTVYWADIWNSPSRVGSSCKILQKNDILALVAFDGDNILSENIYRLENLEIESHEQ